MESDNVKEYLGKLFVLLREVLEEGTDLLYCYNWDALGMPDCEEYVRRKWYCAISEAREESVLPFKMEGYDIILQFDYYWRHFSLKKPIDWRNNLRPACDGGFTCSTYKQINVIQKIISFKYSSREIKITYADLSYTKFWGNILDVLAERLIIIKQLRSKYNKKVSDGIAVASDRLETVKELVTMVEL